MVDSSESAERRAILSHRFKVHPDAYPWLDFAAIEVNQVWNYCNATSYKAIRPYVGKSRWLSGFDLCKLTAGATECYPHIGADTIQRVCVEYAQKRTQARRARLGWRKSGGARRSLGWVPFKAASLRRHGRYLRFCGKSIRFFESKRFAQVSRWRDGCFAQDACGDWYLCLPVEVINTTPAARAEDVGLDLGLKSTVVTSDGDRLDAGRYYRDLEPSIARAQRRGRRKLIRRLHRKAARRRSHAIHVFTRRTVDEYQTITIGDVSSLALTKTRMAKAVLDSGWGLLKAQLKYKGEHAGRCVQIVSERNTSRTCSSCGALTGPQGVNGLRIRVWTCLGCGVIHDRDVNAARCIQLAGRMRPSLRERGAASHGAA